MEESTKVEETAATENSTNSSSASENPVKSKPSGDDDEKETIPIQEIEPADSKNPPETIAAVNTESTSSTVTTHCDPSNVHYEGDVAIYTDPNTGYQYEWDSEKKEWTLKNNMSYEFEDDTHVYTDKDGTKFFWDKDRQAWFPKVDDDFMARYQMSYGFVDNTSTKTGQVDEEHQKRNKVNAKSKATNLFPDDENFDKYLENEEGEDETQDETPEPSGVQTAKGEKRKPSDPSWFEVDETENSKVYVSNLPTDITQQEFVDLMQKCGLVMKDLQTGEFKVKLYKEPGTELLKGDALCTYIRIESVDLALKLLDGSDFKGQRIKVERARFQMKGAYDPKLKPKTKKRKEKQKLKKMQEKLFDWRPEKMLGERAKHEKVVIVKNLFDPSIFDTDVGLILEFQQDLREEASKIGTVRKVIIYDRHPEGVAQINMSSPEEADEVVKMLSGRWFMKRQLTAEIWDGKTKFKIAETDSEISQRIDKWDKFLEDPKEGSAEKNS